MDKFVSPLMDWLGLGTAWQTVIAFALCFAFGLFAITFGSLFAGITSWWERRVAGRIQSRIGPNRVGPQGFWQWLCDGLKCFLKEDIIPTDADSVLFRIAPYLVFSGVFGTFVVLPFSASVVGADLNVGILFLVAITALVVVGILMAGWASASKWTLLGGIRSAAQMISYEIPVALALLVGAIPVGSLSLQDMVRAQGGAPWNWTIFNNPCATIAFVLYFISALAEGNRTPFDLPEAESELVAGYNTEYSGMRFLFFFFAEWMNLYVIGAVATAVFLGGWQIPGVSAATQVETWWLQLFGCALFIGKSLMLANVIIWIRWTLPRLRIDHLMRMCWTYFVPVGVLCVVFSMVFTMWWAAAPAVAFIVRIGLFSICLGLVGLMLRRAWFNLRAFPDHTYFKWQI